LLPLTLDLTQGQLRGTNRTLDVAIIGPGFFTVRTGDGSLAYVRNGSFQINAQRELTDVPGNQVLGVGGAADHAPRG